MFSYMKHIVETKLQINGQNILSKISDILTYFQKLILILLFQKAKIQDEF